MPEPSIPPLNPAVIDDNSFKSYSARDINEFVRNHDPQLWNLNLNPKEWLIIDQRGIETDTCLVARQINHKPRDPYPLDWYAIRVPQAHALEFFLHDLDPSFGEWVESDRDVQEHGYFRWMSRRDDAGLRHRRQVGIDEALAAMRARGHVD